MLRLLLALVALLAACASAPVRPQFAAPPRTVLVAAVGDWSPSERALIREAAERLEAPGVRFEMVAWGATIDVVHVRVAACPGGGVFTAGSHLPFQREVRLSFDCLESRGEKLRVVRHELLHGIGARHVRVHAYCAPGLLAAEMPVRRGLPRPGPNGEPEAWAGVVLVTQPDEYDRAEIARALAAARRP